MNDKTSKENSTGLLKFCIISYIILGYGKTSDITNCAEPEKWRLDDFLILLHKSFSYYQRDVLSYHQYSITKTFSTSSIQKISCARMFCPCTSKECVTNYTHAYENGKSYLRRVVRIIYIISIFATLAQIPMLLKWISIMTFAWHALWHVLFSESVSLMWILNPLGTLGQMCMMNNLPFNVIPW